MAMDEAEFPVSSNEEARSFLLSHPPASDVVDGGDNDSTQPLLTPTEEPQQPDQGLLRQEAALDTEAARRVLHKIDRTIIPLLFITYMLNFMDKIILSSAAVFGLREDNVRVWFHILCVPSLICCMTEPRGTAVQLGRERFLRGISPVDVSDYRPRGPSSCWKVSVRQYPLLGVRCHLDGCMPQLWRTLDGAILARNRRGDHHSRLHVSHINLVHSR